MFQVRNCGEAKRRGSSFTGDAGRRGAANSPREAPGLKRGGFSLAGLLPGGEKLFPLRVVTGFWLEARWSPLWRHPGGWLTPPGGLPIGHFFN